MQGVGPAELISFRAFENAGQGREEVVIVLDTGEGVCDAPN
jgi:hypothetical protein